MSEKPFITSFMEKANKDNLSMALNELSNNIIVPEAELIDKVKIGFGYGYDMLVGSETIKGNPNNKNVLDAAGVYLSGLLNMKGIKKETINGVTTYSINAEEIPGLKGFNTETLKKLKLTTPELASYLASAKTY